MSVRSFHLFAACCLFLLPACAPTSNPAGSTSGARIVTDEQVALLPNGISLAELEQTFGPGPSYPAAKHPGEFFWIHTYQAKEPGSEVMVHHIVRADRSQEGGSVVWPLKWMDLSPTSADYLLKKL